MQKVLILAYCTFSISLVATNRINDLENSEIFSNRTKLKSVTNKVLTKILTNVNTSESLTPDNFSSANTSEPSHKSLGIKVVAKPLHKHTATNRTNDLKTTEIFSNGTKLKSVINKVLTKILSNANTSEEINPNNSTSLNTNESPHKSLGVKVSPKHLHKQDDLGAVEPAKSTNHSISNEKKMKDHKHHSNSEVQKSFSMLMRIHQRITRSKDAVWATITLTVLCVLLVLAVAHSRMWKDKYHSESQGVPLPNFNERVLFKDVMERKVAFLKQFFKKKKRTKEKSVTELESLLPPSEWED